ncbi:HK97 gp10 family phage protein [Bacillus sp. OK048]|uniref:HK97 gp10 family phage protein n=1 Tax=Bacillus sp. OK048 TaxID=1882761 RepID=UPI0008896A18|nr:HK97 gp10 family phage protein [Bacillus sp. OK048]SDM17440.1 phage protein, HK97 gp10 family [Bacillus sp. OK048]
MARNEIIGMKELEKTIKQLGQLPQKVVTKAARQGASVSLKAARANAPVDSGDLKKGIKLVGERTKIKGKKVYQVTLDKALNHVFVKESKAGKRAYYPASQEYGFLTRDGRYVPGYRYLRKSIEDNDKQIQDKVLDVMGKEIDKLK